jgi:hypothetical protein
MTQHLIDLIGGLVFAGAIWAAGFAWAVLP